MQKFTMVTLCRRLSSHKPQYSDPKSLRAPLRAVQVEAVLCEDQAAAIVAIESTHFIERAICLPEPFGTWRRLLILHGPTD